MANEDVLDQRTFGDARPGPLTDGFISVMGGMNAGVNPSLLPQDNPQYAFGVNLTSRGGLLKTRQIFKRLEAYIPPGKFQGAAMYRRAASDKLVFCVAGTVWTLDLVTFARMKVGTFPTTDFDRAYFCQADKYMIVQNGIVYPTENWPIIFEGDFVVDNADVQYYHDTNGWSYLGDRSDYSAVRVPIGTVMAYGHGRLVVAVPRIWDTGKVSGTEQWLPASGRRSFVAGDIFQQDNPTEFLAFTENTYLSGGGAFDLPASMGSIQAMGFLRNSASGTGLGSLLVFGSEGVAAYSINMARDQWQAIDMSQILFMGAGTESYNSIVNINNDLFFRGLDGFRFVRYAVNALGASSNSISNTPESFEITPVLAKDDRNEVPYISAAFVDNRLYVTAAGATVSNEIHFDAVVSLDVATVSSIASADPKPSYDGIWTGHSFLQVLKARYDNLDRLFTFVKVGTRNELWYLVDTSDSNYLDGGQTRVTSKLTTRIFDFKAATRTKEFKFAEVWVSGARGTNTVKAYWRADGYELWNACEEYTFEASTPAAGSLPQSRWRLRLPVASTTTYDPVSGRDVRVGTTFQFCLEWTGNLTIEKVLFHVHTQTEASPDIYCTAVEAVVLSEGTGGSVIDMYDYTIADLGALSESWYRDCSTLGREPLFWWTFDSISDSIYGTITIVGPINPGNITLPDGWYIDEQYPIEQDELDVPPAISEAAISGLTNTETSLHIPYLSPGSSITVPVTAPLSAGGTGNTYYTTYKQDGDIIIFDPEEEEIKGTEQKKDVADTTKTDLVPEPASGGEEIRISFSTPSFSLTPGIASKEYINIANYSGFDVSVSLAEVEKDEVVDPNVTLEYYLQYPDNSEWQKTSLPEGLSRIANGDTVQVQIRALAAVGAYAPGSSPVNSTYQFKLDATKIYESGADEQLKPVAPYTYTRPVEVTVTPLTAKLAISPASLSYLYQTGGTAPASQTFVISNSGTGTATWTLAVSGSNTVGATFSSSTGTLAAGASTTITASVSSALAGGDYSSTFTVSAPGSDNVTLTIAAQVIPYSSTVKVHVEWGIGVENDTMPSLDNYYWAGTIDDGVGGGPWMTFSLGSAGYSGVPPTSVAYGVNNTGVPKADSGTTSITYDTATGMPAGGPITGTNAFGSYTVTFGVSAY